MKLLVGMLLVVMLALGTLPEVHPLIRGVLLGTFITLLPAYVKLANDD